MRITFTYLIYLLTGCSLLFAEQARDTVNQSEKIFFINSIPYNAELYFNNIIIGLTPVRVYSDSLSNKELTLKRAGYFDSTFILKQNNLLIELRPVKNKEELVKTNFHRYFKKQKNFTVIGSITLFSLGSGISSYLLKNKANDYYNEYVNTLNRDFLDKSKRYDLYSGVTLALMQAGLAYVVYLLFFDE
jgi:hypothetical protein